MDTAFLASKIAALDSGQLVGIVADDPGLKIELKTLHGAILNDHDALKRDQDGYKPVPVIRQVTPAIVQAIYIQIKQEIDDLINTEMARILSDPAQIGSVPKKDSFLGIFVYSR